MPARCDNFLAANFMGRRADGSCTHHQHGQDINGCFFGQSSFASHALVRERHVVKVPDDVPLELLGPLGCGIQTGAGTILNHLKPQPGSSVVIFGAGAVGLSAVMAARIAGCATIIAVDVQPARLALARELGATHALHERELGIERVVGGGHGTGEIAAGGRALPEGKLLAQHRATGEAYARMGNVPGAIEQMQIALRSGDGDFYQLSAIEARLKDLRKIDERQRREQRR